MSWPLVELVILEQPEDQVLPGVFSLAVKAHDYAWHAALGGGVVLSLLKPGARPEIPAGLDFDGMAGDLLDVPPAFTAEGGLRVRPAVLPEVVSYYDVGSPASALPSCC